MVLKRCVGIGILMISFYNFLQAQSISGRVIDEQGAPLPYASIIVRNTDIGAVSNQEGYFRIQLQPNTNYQLRIQYVGYRTRDTTILTRTGDIMINIKLSPESLTLPTVTIDGQNEDPSYTIMRRAIGKASYHANQINAYRAKVYIKGSGRLLKVPFLFKNKIKKELAKEGIDSTVAFTQESVSRLSYKRPGQYKDTVISMLASGQDNNTSPMGFIYSSFYDAQVSGSVSPLAPTAFQIYKFEYLGYIEDHGVIINKIKVNPKGRGDQVFEGLIYITDQLWSIHSLDLITSIWGIQFSIKQVFSPVQSEVWMPVDQIYDVKGDVFGFGFSYKYLAHLSDYKITLNPDVQVALTVLDDKLNKDESKVANEVIQKNSNPFNINELKQGQELSAKQLRKMMKEYEKKEIESLPSRDTATAFFSESAQVIDSMAVRRDSLYWAEIRPVALTTYELKGYSIIDSVSTKKAIADKKKKESKDSSTLNISIGSEGSEMSIHKANKGFQLKHLLYGANYKLDSSNHYLKLHAIPTAINFNSVDGYRLALITELGSQSSKAHPVQWNLKPELLYTFSRRELNYKLTATLKRPETKQFKNPWSWTVEGGHYAESFNNQLTTNSYLNTAYSLLFKKNYLKLYEKNYLRSDIAVKLNKAIGFNASIEWADREELLNTTNYSYFNRKKTYTANTPILWGDRVANISSHRALISNLQLNWTPFYSMVVTNGYKSEDRSNSPVFSMQYKKGWATEDSPFDLVSIGIRHHVAIGAGDDLDYHIQAGTFPNANRPSYFHDFVQFPGNQYIFSPTDPNKYFRMLDYHLFSTNRSYASLLSNYQFRRFLFTTSPWVRKRGIRENIIFNALTTSDKPVYGELGYSINYLFRFLRIEAVTSWHDFKYRDFAIRFGVATGFENLFKF